MNRPDDIPLWVYFAAIFGAGVGFMFVIKWLVVRLQRGLAAGPASASARWFARLFESEGEPSARIILACVVVVFSLVMQALARISDNQLEANYFLAGTLLGLGTAKIVGKALAARPVVPAQITAAKADVGVAGDATITGATVREQP